ncbi:MAG TPA: nucleotidyltransferase family protein [Trueperaceae bacterium]|nr:nucleotidyltransferase family protein [Trueperaceae bacterium]
MNEQEALRLRGTATGVLIYQNRNALIEAGNRLGATNLRVFGSVARGDAGPDSDIDILVDLAPTVSLIGLGELEEAFAKILGRKVDAVPASGLKSGIRAAVLKEAIPLEPK